MTLDEFKALVKEQLGEALSEKGDGVWSEIEKGLDATVNSSVSGVIENRDKILAEKKSLAEKHKELEEQMKKFEEEGVTLEAWSELKQKAELAADGDNKDTSAIQKQSYEQGRKSMEQELMPKLKDYEESVKQQNQVNEQLKQRHINALTDVEINRALNELNVETDPFWLSGLRHSATVEYVESEDTVQIELPNPGDPSQKLPLKDWKRIFPTTEEGKRRVRVKSGGSGANGSSGKEGGSGRVSLVDSIAGLGFSK